MPNWCTNVIEAIFPTESRAILFIEENRVPNSFGEEVDFTPHKYVPMPGEIRHTYAGNYGNDEPEKQAALLEHQAAMVAKYGNKDWYGWSNANWGSKWDTTAKSVEVERHDTTVTIRFDTAWGPYSEQVYEAMSTAYPDAIIAMSYDEPGMDFGGVIIYHGGNQIDHMEGGSKMGTWEDIGRNIVDSGIVESVTQEEQG